LYRLLPQNSVARPAEALGKPSTVPEISSSKATSAGAPKLPVAAEKPQSEGLTDGGKEERTPKQPENIFTQDFLEKDMQKYPIVFLLLLSAVKPQEMDL
jgi:hypothetical protein